MANIKTTDVPPNRCSLLPPTSRLHAPKGQTAGRPASQPTGCLVAYMWPHQQHQWKPHTMQNYHHNSRFISMITRNNKKYISRYTHKSTHSPTYTHTNTRAHMQHLQVATQKQSKYSGIPFCKCHGNGNQYSHFCLAGLPSMSRCVCMAM